MLHDLAAGASVLAQIDIALLSAACPNRASHFGRGTLTFYGGHDPEDYQHAVGDPPTNLNLYKNSPGYRLILNNILFPAATKKKQKT